jgi:hypothetical protein
VFVSCTSTTSSLGGMARWRLDGRRAVMGSSRVVAPSDAVVESMVGLVRGFVSV